MYQDKKNSIFASQKLRSNPPETARKKHLAVPQNPVQNIRPCLFWKKGKPKKLSARRMAPSKRGLEDHKSIYITSIEARRPLLLILIRKLIAVPQSHLASTTLYTFKIYSSTL